MQTHKSVAIYVRVSTPGQEKDGYSIDEQIDKLKKYCELQEWDIHKVYKDGGYSGSNLKRPAITQLITDVKSNKVDTVLVYKLDRLSRSLVDTMQLVENTFNAHDVAFVSLSESFDTTTPVGKVMISILATFAQFERENIRSRMQMGKIGRAKSGKIMSWANPPFGYDYSSDRNSYEINDAASKVVKSIFEDYLSGTSLTKVRDNLNDAGHIAKDVRWSYRTVRQVLDNISYTGKFKFKDKIYQGDYTPIISEEDYQKTQAELKRRQLTAFEFNHNSRPFRAKYMLSGMIFCSYCGARFSVQISKRHKTGEKLFKYKCISKISRKSTFTNKRADSCPGPSFYRMPEIEQEVINRIMSLDFKDVRAHKKQDNSKLYEQELLKIDKQISKLLELTMDDTMPLDAIKQKIEEAQTRRQQVTKKIEDELSDHRAMTKSVAKSIIANLPTTLDKCDYEIQKSVVHELIERVNLSEDTVSITWRF